MIQVLERTAKILEYIASRSGREVPLSEIADTLGINRGTCANILRTLITLGYVHQSACRAGYVIGDGAYALAGMKEAPDNLVKTVKPLIDKLCSEVNENIMLAVIKNGRRILPYTVKGNHRIEARTIEEMTPWDATTAKVIMAHYNEDELSALIRRAGMPGDLWPEVKTRADLTEQLAKIRGKETYTVINRHFACIAAPVFRDGKAIASIGAYLPDIRLSDGRQENLERRLAETAAAAGQALSLQSPRNQGLPKP